MSSLALLSFVPVILLSLTGVQSQEDPYRFVHPSPVEVSSPIATNPGKTPEETIEEFFASWNARDPHRWFEVLSTARRPNAGTNLSYFKSARVLKIDANRALIKAADYQRDHPELQEVKTFWVTFEVQFFREESMTNGVHSWNMILVRETVNGPWLIADWGY